MGARPMPANVITFLVIFAILVIAYTALYPTLRRKLAERKRLRHEAMERAEEERLDEIWRQAWMKSHPGMPIPERRRAEPEE